MGNKSSKSSKSKKKKRERVSIKASKTNQSVPTKANSRKTRLEWTEMDEIGFDIASPPFLNGNNAIFLSTSNGSTICNVYNLKTKSFITKAQKVKCEIDGFDVKNTVYTFNPNNNTVYFVANNKDILTLNMDSNSIISLNKSIETMNDNHATIQFINNSVYIVGAEEKSDQSDEYRLIPYSSAGIQIIKNIYK